MARASALLLAGVAALLLLSGCGGAASSAATDATIRIHFSRFEPERLTAVVGVPLTITLENEDPIAHEWIVGTDAVHETHRTGTEPFHASRPTEVTILALSTHHTTVVFAEPGDYKYICHLPGHEKYGMIGTLHVTAAE